MNHTTITPETRLLKEAKQKDSPSLNEPRDGEGNVLLTLFQEATAEQERRVAQEKARIPRPFTHD